MGLCKFEKNGWKCPLDAEMDSDYCYWHQEIDGKKPTSEQLTELENKKIRSAYLKKGHLNEAKLQGANLFGADLQGANLEGSDLQGANLMGAKLKGVCLVDAKLQGAYLEGADLRGANLMGAKLQGANLMKARLKGTGLIVAKLQGADLFGADLQRAGLMGAKLQGANLFGADLQGAHLLGTKLQGANLFEAKLQGANLELTTFDSASRLDRARLKDVNLHISYIDFAKSFRNASLFEQEVLNEKEVNEKIADCVIPKSSKIHYNVNLLFEVNEIDKFVYDTCDVIGKYLFDELRLENKVKQAIWSSDLNSEYILYSDILDFITDIGQSPNSKRVKNKIDSLLFQEELEQSFFFYNPIIKRYSGFVRVSSENRFLYNDVSNVKLYEASKEIYSKLYHFYSDEGMTFRTKHAHYRRAEVDRKLLLVRNKWNSFQGLKDRARSWLFDWFVLKMLTGYGESILRPVLISIFWIIAFGFIYMTLEGVKVAGRAVNWFDYFYLSMTTFTSLGFADVQPNVSVIGMQPLIMAESTMGVAMVALIIFVITYQISR